MSPEAIDKVQIRTCAPTSQAKSLTNYRLTLICAIIIAGDNMIVVRLDRVMADKKMTLKELAKEAQISEVNLSRLKNGHVKAIRFSTLNALCEVLKCQPRDLLEFYYDI